MQQLPFAPSMTQAPLAPLAALYQEEVSGSAGPVGMRRYPVGLGMDGLMVATLGDGAAARHSLNSSSDVTCQMALLNLNENHFQRISSMGSA
jgi:hypothetical protein